MTSILLPDSPYSPYLQPKQYGGFDFGELQTTSPSEDLEAQRIQGAAIHEQMQIQDVAAAQLDPQGLATPTVLGPKRGGSIREAAEEAAAESSGINPLWLGLGALGLLFLLRRR